MKIFLSWSQPRSKAVAKALRDWLPTVMVTAEPWMSEEDIEKGQRWSSEIAGQLAESKVGIICVTRENADQPWLNFEAGAISKTVAATYVCPLLFQLAPADLTGPLAQFQATKTEKGDVKRLLETINKAVAANGERAFDQGALDRAFERAWQDLETDLAAIPPPSAPAVPHRSDREVLNEILETVRRVARTSVAVAVAPGVWPGSLGTGIDIDVVRRLLDAEGQKWTIEHVLPRALEAAAAKAARKEPESAVEEKKGEPEKPKKG